MLKRSRIARRAMAASLAAFAGLAVSTAASAAVTFTFQDPSNAREFEYSAGDDQSDGQISYNSPMESSLLELTVDASDHGLAPITYQATLEIDLSVGQATDIGVGAIADVSGTFQFLDMSRGVPSLILSGVITDGQFFVIGTTGAQVSSSDENSLVLSAGPVLQDYLDMAGLTLAEQMDSSFSLSSTRLDGGMLGSPGINEYGYIESFTSNAAYVGSANVVPSPPAAMTLAAFAIAAPRRRRRAS